MAGIWKSIITDAYATIMIIYLVPPLQEQKNPFIAQSGRIPILSKL